MGQPFSSDAYKKVQDSFGVSIWNTPDYQLSPDSLSFQQVTDLLFGSWFAFLPPGTVCPLWGGFVHGGRSLAVAGVEIRNSRVWKN